jgi:hypothetical protein
MLMISSRIKLALYSLFSSEGYIKPSIFTMKQKIKSLGEGRDAIPLLAEASSILACK